MSLSCLLRYLPCRGILCLCVALLFEFDRANRLALTRRTVRLISENASSIGPMGGALVYVCVHRAVRLDQAFKNCCSLLFG